MLGLLDIRIGDRVVEAITRSPHLSQLSELDLRENRLTPAAAQALIDWPHRERLTELSLLDNDLSDELLALVQIE